MRRASLLLLAACGGGGHHTSDASAYDAPADTLAMSSDAAANGVTLQITSGGDPVPNVATMFLDAQDKQVAAVTTNASGTAAASVGAGGSVTAVIHEGAGLDHLMTFTDVQPGDALAIDLQPPGPNTAPSITLTATPNGSPYYQLFPSCGDTVGSLDGTFSFTPRGCGGTADFVIATSPDMSNYTGFLVAVGVPVAANATLPGTIGAVRQQAFAYTDVPSTVADITTRAVLLGHNGPMYAAESTHAFGTGETAVTVHEPMPDTTGLSLSSLVVSNLYPQDSELGQQTIFDIVDSSIDYATDVTTSTLPRYITAPAYDAASRTIGWGEAPASVAANLVRARVHAYRDDVPSGRSWTWEIVGAKTATSVTFPALPALDGFSFVPIATDTVGVDELTTASLPGGYAALRANAFRDPATLVTTGRAVVETMFAPNL